MNTIVRITIEENGKVDSGIFLDMESVEKAGPNLFEVVVKDLIAKYKVKQKAIKKKRK